MTLELTDPLIALAEIIRHAMQEHARAEQIASQEAELLTAAAAWEKLAEERNALARGAPR